MTVDLVTLATVKAFRDWSTDATRDALLTQMITDISTRFEGELCGRLLLQSSRTVLVNVLPGQRTFHLPAIPISTSPVITIKNSADRDWTISDIDSGDYFVQDEIGVVTFETSLESGLGALQVIYRGGVGSSASAVETAAPDITDAIKRQVVYEFERKDNLGKTSESIGVNGNQKSWGAAGGWLPEVQGVIDRHKLVVIG